MNQLLKEHGYLDGIPGAYGVTEKGQQFAEYHDHSRGTGGYTMYNPQWETRSWNDETAAALKADMEANPGEVSAEIARRRALIRGAQAGIALQHVDDVPADEADEADEADISSTRFTNLSASTTRVTRTDEIAKAVLPIAIVVGVVVGAVYLAPHVKPFWKTKVKPAAKKLRNKLTKQGPDDLTPDGHDELRGFL